MLGSDRDGPHGAGPGDSGDTSQPAAQIAQPPIIELA